MATIIEISDRQWAESSIRDKTQQLEGLNSELLEFAYSAPHDLKAPLTSIADLLEFCKCDLEAGELDEVRENIGKAEELASRLSLRVESALSLAQSDIGPR